MLDYTEKFPEGDRELPERYLTDEEVLNKKRKAVLQYFARLERQTYEAVKTINEAWLPF